MKSKVFVTRRIPQPGLDILEKRFEVKVNPYDRVLSKEDGRSSLSSHRYHR